VDQSLIAVQRIRAIADRTGRFKISSVKGPGIMTGIVFLCFSDPNPNDDNNDYNDNPNNNNNNDYHNNPNPNGNPGSGEIIGNIIGCFGEAAALVDTTISTPEGGEEGEKAGQGEMRLADLLSLSMTSFSG
jgi:hypothetical protein